MAKKRKTTKKVLNDKQKRFALEYTIDFSKTQSAIRAGYSKATAGQQGYELANNPLIKEEIKRLQSATAETVGISKIAVAMELKKIAFSSMADYSNGWMDQKTFEELTPDQKSALSEIRVTKKTFGEMTEELIQLKLHDKLKAIEAIIKMFGYNEPEEINIGGSASIPLINWIKEDSGE